MKKIIIIFMLSLLMSLPSSSQTSAQDEMFNMSYIFFGSPSSYVSQVDKTKGSLYVVSPNYFDITTEGKLDITWRLQSSFISEMHKRGIKVVPFLANHWNATAGINGLNNRDQLARDVAAAVEKYNLNGVNVDIEGVGSAYRDAHTDFIRLLRQYIPKHKEVSVSVAANPNGWKTGWHGFYDYNALGRYADYLMIMAYDESWESPDSPVGPVSSLSFFERSIQYAVNQGVPRDRIVAGLPFYGRMWKLDGPTLEGKSITGMGLSSTRVEPLVSQFNGKIQFDDQTQSSYATFRIPNGQNTFIGSTNLTEGDYVIWYENEPSIKAKLRLPKRYGIKGTGSWALYHETPDTWDYYSLTLNGKFFTDVTPTHWGEESIIFTYEKGWMKGTTSTQFSPGTSLTRAQGAVILGRALGYGSATPNQYIFTDTKGHWASRDIEVARELGIINGLGNNRFGPDDPLTREQLAAILQNIFKYCYEEVPKSPFPDISSDDWSYPSILAIQQSGYLSGFEDGSFRPRSKSTRAQMAVLMTRMATEFEALTNR
jgi:spore germination protein YaaH